MAISCWTVTSQIAVIKREGGWEEGAGGGQRADGFGRHSCSENPSLDLLLRFGKQVGAALIGGRKVSSSLTMVS